MFGKEIWASLLLLSLLAVSSAEDRIYNGTEAKPDLNNVVFFGTRNQDKSIYALCTGTVVSEHYILTAAHCLPSSQGFVQIWTRDAYHHNGSMLSAPAFVLEPKFYIHPEYCGKNSHDIGLIKVETPMTISPVPLAANYSHPKDDWLRVAGYGTTKYQIFNASTNNLTFSELSKTLMETYLQARSSDDCFNASLKIDYPGWHAICMYKHDSTILPGDDGGPAFAQGKDGRFYQVGVNVNVATSEYLSLFLSWNMPFQSPCTLASVSTDVSYYCPWIEARTGGEVKCQTFKSTPIVP